MGWWRQWVAANFASLRYNLIGWCRSQAQLPAAARDRSPRSSSNSLLGKEWSISEFSFAYVWKRVKVRNLSYENKFCMQFHFHANQSHFHKNSFALRLALKQRHKGTRKWPIKTCPSRMLFPAFWEPLNEATRANLQVNKRILKWRPFWNKVYSRIPKVKNGWETTEEQLKRQRIALKGLVKRRSHYLS